MRESISDVDIFLDLIEGHNKSALSLTRIASERAWGQASAVYLIKHHLDIPLQEAMTLVYQLSAEHGLKL